MKDFNIFDNWDEEEYDENDIYKDIYKNIKNDIKNIVENNLYNTIVAMPKILDDYFINLINKKNINITNYKTEIKGIHEFEVYIEFDNKKKIVFNINVDNRML